MQNDAKSKWREQYRQNRLTENGGCNVRAYNIITGKEPNTLRSNAHLWAFRDEIEKEISPQIEERRQQWDYETRKIEDAEIAKAIAV